MSLVLDTHTLLWLMEADPSLSATAAGLLADPSNRLFLSVASCWELGIKVGLRKLGLSVPLASFLATDVGGYGLTILPITIDDCVNYESLPFPDPQHRDSFDRMLIIQSRRNRLAVVGADTAFDAHGVTRLW